MNATINRSFIRSRYVAALAMIFLGGVTVAVLGYRELAGFRTAFDAYHETEEIHGDIAATLIAAADRALTPGHTLATPDSALVRRLDKLETELKGHHDRVEFLPPSVKAAFASFIGIARKMAAPVTNPEADLTLHHSILFSIAETQLQPQMDDIIATLDARRNDAWWRLQALIIGAIAAFIVALLGAAWLIFRPMERHILQAQVLLERETERAQAAERSKGAFLANMSHEIRTALNGVIGVTELLARTRLDGGQAEYIGLMRASGAAVLRLINDILDFSKIAAGEMTLETARFAPRAVLVETARLAASIAEGKGVRVVLDIDPALPRCAMGDAVRLRQITANLLQNAAKFTRAGRIELCA
ncbi:MAG: hypothetical protein CVT86_03860, partial [Alphaproteobacteria bacterium HGW-Alphaproteobacteria-8]